MDARHRGAKWRAENQSHVKKYNKKYLKEKIETTRGISPGAVGVIGEMLVKMDLMLRGFPVTQPCDPQGKHDLHVELPSRGWSGVQVKVVRVNKVTGRWTWNSWRGVKSPICALVRISTKEIRYEAGTKRLPRELR